MSNPVVTLTTNYGDIVIELDAKNAPLSTANMVKYAKSGFYDGLIFHRVIGDFMIQGGGFDATMKEKADKHPTIQNEAANGLKNDRGTIAMARTMDPHSASSQFFINLKDNAFLNHSGQNMQGWGYAVFGKVTQGMDVVDKIAAVETGNSGMHENVPTQAVMIEKATVAE